MIETSKYAVNNQVIIYSFEMEKKKNWAGGKYHRFEQFFINFLCLSQPHINNVSRQINLDQDVEWIIQVLTGLP